MKQAVITGVAGFLPDYVLTNQELETMVDTNDQWIRERTGIVERRLLKEKGKGTSDLAVPAVLELLKKTGTAPEDVDLVVCCTVTADFRFPDTGTLICHKAGLTNAYGYDLSAACSGFVYGLHAAAQYIKAGTHKKVIVVGADKMSSIMDYTNRNTCILFGDGAGVVMLEPSDDETLGLQETVLYGDGSGGAELYQLGGGSVHGTTQETLDKNMHVIEQNGRVVFKRAVKGMSSAIKNVLEKSNLAGEDIKWVVPHQANIRIIESVAGQLDFPMEKVMVTIEKYGNTTAATIPLCLRDYESQLKKGDQLILTAFGGGYTWGAIRLVWGYNS
jgi:3-oxoacyl-[acyl-carrier-protein] synthase-3